jgi:hypothetical protein
VSLGRRPHIGFTESDEVFKTMSYSKGEIWLKVPLSGL